MNIIGGLAEAVGGLTKVLVVDPIKDMVETLSAEELEEKKDDKIADNNAFEAESEDSVDCDAEGDSDSDGDM